MDGKDADRMVLAKPVASRPRAHFKSFTELLAGAINASPVSTFSETTVAIRPKTVRFKPSVNRAPVGVSQGEISGAAVCCSSGRVPEPDRESTVVYKPLAKLVSRTTASLLANLGNFDVNNQQLLAQPQAIVQLPDQVKHSFPTQLASNLHQKLPSQTEENQIIDPSKSVSQNPEQNQRALLPTSTGDRPSYDGYNWRKYGQKHVKGSEFPRSYYKCTNPNCPVKKKVERSLDGQIAEIVYKGEHNHPKPQPQKRVSSGTQGQVFISDGNEKDSANPVWSNPLNERNEGSDDKIEDPNEVGLSVNPTYPAKLIFPQDPAMAAAFNSCVGTPDNSCGLSGDCEEGSGGVDGDDEPNCKRRKNEDQANEGGKPVQAAREPHVVVQTSTESEILGDGFRWRKYGQKVVKGNPYPRSYYRCTSLKCNVRKHVERVSDDPRAFITTYEGKHNHDMPVSRSMNPVASDSDSLAPTNKSKP
ncbi:WRKY transcription factor 44 [Magnolia sinica]|uniref:WRKY transcription factor 44 n=1 Tax=Magnolia sinica TaxID=86752 RepID=UPI00265806D9|nr:WRKY transcription factor 44 [Magnolia sinica]XP_058109961.1 WRKY transcription factor 44 [Magnolia sinica]XP_058109962.1 WRKY transcription factor 44 [Magnolia sinica]XP_058109963.1 WRKY transcription factor 44 [Magnolia sinica]XP_058109964.1 WRKY transcription factor 44 [Magnolia sinica]XP_058109965.1 WRKY transcription factor 44 [Magnolia sinica]XP_058109966.1 WRKY transcription factor 44 [Magnolia sinica]XP_058109967.1 WRKY transcription factor 44 [Magnolia sinica]XP_058109968.1 WRKY